MKLNIHLECFAMRKDLSTEKRKCQVLLCQKCVDKQNHPVKLVHYLLENTLADFFLISRTSCLD